MGTFCVIDHAQPSLLTMWCVTPSFPSPASCMLSSTLSMLANMPVETFGMNNSTNDLTPRFGIHSRSDVGRLDGGNCVQSSLQPNLTDPRPSTKPGNIVLLHCVGCPLPKHSSFLRCSGMSFLITRTFVTSGVIKNGSQPPVSRRDTQYAML